MLLPNLHNLHTRQCHNNLTDGATPLVRTADWRDLAVIQQNQLIISDLSMVASGMRKQTRSQRRGKAELDATRLSFSGPIPHSPSALREWVISDSLFKEDVEHVA